MIFCDSRLTFSDRISCDRTVCNSDSNQDVTNRNFVTGLQAVFGDRKISHYCDSFWYIPLVLSDDVLYRYILRHWIDWITGHY